MPPSSRATNTSSEAAARPGHDRARRNPERGAIERFDLIVIGGGINGAAIAREVALAGRSVLLLERDDICSGTSAASTRLIHGGLRYLEYGEIGLVRESLAERERLLRHAPHLVEPLELVLPIYRGRGRPRWQIGAGMLLYDLLSFDRSLPGHRMLSREALLARIPALARDGLAGGAAYFDAQVSYPERLVVELAVDAVRAGAKLLTRAPVTALDISAGRIEGVEYEVGGERRRAAAATVVNAAGPWADRVLAGTGTGRLIGGTQGAHLVAVPFPGAPPTAVYAQARSDGRPFFVIPWNGLYLIGTTDERFDGDPGTARASAAECRYLADEAAQLFAVSSAFEQYVRYTQAGVRPLPHQPGGSTGAITRRHIVHRHRNIDGLYSIIGGKLTTERALAEAVARKLRARLQLPAASPTRDRPLPGALSAPERDALIGELGQRFDTVQCARLWRIYGGAARRILELADAGSEFAMSVGPGSNVLVAELVHALDEEFAGSLVDVLARRTMAGLAADRGLATAPRVADWLIRLGRWDRDRAAAEVDAYRAWAALHSPAF